MTYPATGEGIGKAMESGLLAAGIVGEALAGRRSIESLHHVYGDEFRRRFLGHYAAYDIAERWASHPWLLDLLAWRAYRGRFVQRELESLVAESGDPRRLFSTRGLLTAFFR